MRKGKDLSHLRGLVLCYVIARRKISRYIVYWEGSTRYFMEKNQRGDISVNIAKISPIYRLGEIYRRFFEIIASGGKISVIYRRYIGNIEDISLIFW